MWLVRGADTRVRPVDVTPEALGGGVAVPADPAHDGDARPRLVSEGSEGRRGEEDRGAHDEQDVEDGHEHLLWHAEHHERQPQPCAV